MAKSNKLYGVAITSALVGRFLVATLAFAGPRVAVNPSPADDAKGKLQVSYLYLPPEGIEPTYHTVMWLEDESGKLVRTLYVSQDLSATEYKLGDACPDWVKLADWDKAEKSLVDAVTGPTPNVGGGSLEFELDKMGIPAGNYEFKFEVNITENYNLLFKAKISLSGVANEGKMEVLYNPSKPPVSTDFVRDVEVRYTP